MEQVLRNVDETDVRQATFMEGIHKAFRTYQAYKTGEGQTKETKDMRKQIALAAFDRKVKEIGMKVGRGKTKKGARNAYDASVDTTKGKVSVGGCGAVYPVKKDPPGDPCCYVDGDTSCGGGKMGGRSGRERNYPDDAHPENIWLSFAERKSDWHAMGVAWKHTHTDTPYSTIKYGNRRLHPPGWMLNLSAAQLKTVKSIKDYLTALNPNTVNMASAIDDLHKLVLELGILDVTKPEITRVLRYLPLGKHSGLDYRAFLLAIGDFQHARRNNALHPNARKFKHRPDQSDSLLKNLTDKEIDELFEDAAFEFDPYFDMGDFKPFVVKQDPPPYPIRNPGEYVPTRERQAMYEWRKRFIANRHKALEEKAKWAAEVRRARLEENRRRAAEYKRLLEERKQKEAAEKAEKEAAEKKRAEKLERLAQLYVEQGLPRTTAIKKAKSEIKRQEHNRLQNDKMRDTNNYSPRAKIAWSALFMAEMFDAMDMIRSLATGSKAIPGKRVPPNQDELQGESTAGSPYLDPLPFVSNRLADEVKGKHKEHRRSIAFEHRILDLPAEGDGRLLMTENQFRIRSILKYVAFKDGSALCHLPRVELMLHFAHNLVHQILGRSESDIPDPPFFGKKSDGKDDPASSDKPKTAPAEGSHDKAEESKKKKKCRPKSDSTGTEAKSASATDSKSAQRLPFPNTSAAGYTGSEDILHPDDKQLPISEICGTKLPKRPPLPRKFESAENEWGRKYAESLYRPSRLPAEVRPNQAFIPYGQFHPLRKELAKGHAQEWNDYNCRRLLFRKALWESMQVQNYEEARQRNKFAYTFWTLLPHQNEMPKALLNTNVERSLLQIY